MLWNFNMLEKRWRKKMEKNTEQVEETTVVDEPTDNIKQPV